MPQYKTLTHVLHSGKQAAPSVEITLTEKHAAPLLKIGAIEAVPVATGAPIKSADSTKK